MTGKSEAVPLKVGLIGAGLQGKRRSRALRQCGDKLVAAASGHLEKAELLVAEMGGEAVEDWRDVLTRDDVDTVVICTPPDLHEPMCLEAVKAGKHILCEKPLARNPQESQRIVDAASRSDIKLKCGFNHRHHPGIRQAKLWLDQGLIGAPLFVRSRYGIGGRTGYEKDWRADAEIAGGGQLMDQGMHLIDLSRWFLGDFVSASGLLQTGFWDIKVEDNAFGLLRTARGQVSSIHVSWTQWKNLFSFELFGKDGYITVEGLGGSYGVEKAFLGKRAFLEPFKEEVIEFRGEDRSWEEEWREFQSAIAEDREPLGNGQDGLEAVRLAYMVYESAQISSAITYAPGKSTRQRTS